MEDSSSWKDISNFEGLYQVNRSGEVRSIARAKENNGGTQVVNERLLKQRVDKDGYLAVTLCKSGRHYGRRVSRLVAEAYIPNPLNLPVVNHKDENKQNNDADNLEWCTVQYNTTYGTGIERMAKKQGRPVLQISDGDVIAEYYSSQCASRSTGIPQANIHKVCSGLRHRAGGYEWRFKNEY